MLKEDKATLFVSSLTKILQGIGQPCSYRQPFQPAETIIIQNCCILCAPPGETGSNVQHIETKEDNLIA
jgi:hypothetical protein